MVICSVQIKLTAQEEVALELRASQVGVIELAWFRNMFIMCVHVHCLQCLKAEGQLRLSWFFILIYLFIYSVFLMDILMSEREQSR